MAFLVKMLVHLQILCRDGISHYSSYNIMCWITCLHTFLFCPQYINSTVPEKCGKTYRFLPLEKSKKPPIGRTVK